MNLATNVDLSGSWGTLWGALTAGMGQGLPRLMTIIGVGLVAFAILKWAWDRRRSGGGGGGGGIIGALIIGALLAAPTIILPIGLVLVDGVANAAIEVFKSSGIS